MVTSEKNAYLLCGASEGMHVARFRILCICTQNQPHFGHHMEDSSHDAYAYHRHAAPTARGPKERIRGIQYDRVVKHDWEVKHVCAPPR